MKSINEELEIKQYNKTFCYSELLPESFLDKYKDTQPPWGFNGVGYVVYKRTYARRITEGLTEEWWQTIARCINGAQKIGAQYTKTEAQVLFDLVFNLKCSFGGRMLWQLGTSTVDRFGLASLLNCYYIGMTELEDFCFLFEHLMLGGGVGFSVKRENIYQLPKVKDEVEVTHKETNDADFIVPDSREGWVELLRRILNSFFVTGKSFSYSTVLVRKRGTLIKGFGGVASGPEILVEGMQTITNILKSRANKRLRSVDVLDINNLIGSIVVAGNVRRSAEIAIGDPDDYLFIRAKNWSNGKIPNWRGNSNNTIAADCPEQISKEFWSIGYEVDDKTKMAKGEPYGLVNLPLCRTRGRLIDEALEIEDNCEGVNPCAEITLADGEACNLCEIFLNNIDSAYELQLCAKLLYKTQKVIWTLPCLYKKTKDIVQKNMRIGLGVTGICQSLDKIEWLDACYVELRRFDKEWSQQRGWPVSVKYTTVKPSGTLSLLSGSTPGVHPAYSRYFIRRITIASDDPLVEICKDAGLSWEYKLNFDGTEDRNSILIQFPCAMPENTLTSKDMSALRQLELVKELQTYWADNSVSVTVYYKPEELEGIKKWISENYKDNCKTLSFLLHTEHGFKQAPYEEIDENTYTTMSSEVKPIIIKNGYSSEVLNVECSSGACPIR